MFPWPTYILPVMVWVEPPMRFEVNCMSAEKGVSCGITWAGRQGKSSKTVTRTKKIPRVRWVTRSPWSPGESKQTVYDEGLDSWMESSAGLVRIEEAAL